MIELKPTRRENYDFSKMKHHDGGKVENPLDFDLEAELDYAANGSISYQNGYPSFSIHTLRASRNVVREAFDFSSVRNGAEFGCGAYGRLYNYFLPRNSGWRQFDINQKAVLSNRKYSRKFLRSPAVAVGSLYEMPLGDSSVDVIAGLSSWDSILFFEGAADEVQRCLVPGGWFVHYQDLQPAEMPLLLTEARKRVDRGLAKDVPCEVYSEVVECDIPGLYMIDENIVSIDSLEFGLVRLGEYLTRHMARLFANRGFSVHTAGEVRGEYIENSISFNLRLMRHGYRAPENANRFESAYGKLDYGHDESVSKGRVRQSSAMDVLVVQKT
ncbi:MAG: methyltransferase domain-containing protein [Candidatus Aenigmarchaeota archaeon]|nr:methyltransferase domain-containing protein [Candidatus Aenigmarchaeota archaeon]